MKKISTFIIVTLATITALVASSGASDSPNPNTLGEATREVISRTQVLIETVRSGPLTWGGATALKDLELVNHAARNLDAALDGTDASLLKSQQRALATARRRIRTSKSLLPANAQPELRKLENQADAINSRLTQLRLRFASKAARTPSALRNVALVSDAMAIAGYENPAALLIDVRAAKLLMQSFHGEGDPEYTIGFEPSYDLEPSQIRRLIRASSALERSLSGRYEDVQESLPSWRTMKHEYERLGNLSPAFTSRRLERVMERLEGFFGTYE